MKNETVKQFAEKLGRCPICWSPLVREPSSYESGDYICCPSHEEGHTVYLEGDFAE